MTRRAFAPLLLAFLDWLDGRLSTGLPQMDREAVVDDFLAEWGKR